MGLVFLMRLLAGAGFTWLVFWLPLGRKAPTRCSSGYLRWDVMMGCRASDQCWLRTVA